MICTKSFVAIVIKYETNNCNYLQFMKSKHRDQKRQNCSYNMYVCGAYLLIISVFDVKINDRK